MGSNQENLNFLTENISQNQQKKRADYIEWDEYFMAMTFLEIRRSNSKKINDAAIILNKRKIIISMASSAIPNEGSNVVDSHAEFRALSKIQRGHVIYTTTFPCEDCVKFMAETGITEMIYYKDITDSNKVKDLLDQYGIKYRQFYPRRKKIDIDFSHFCDE